MPEPWWVLVCWGAGLALAGWMLWEPWRVSRQRARLERQGSDHGQ